MLAFLEMPVSLRVSPTWEGVYALWMPKFVLMGQVWEELAPIVNLHPVLALDVQKT